MLKKLSLIILGLLFAICCFSAVVTLADTEDPVVVFVIDTEVSYQFINDRTVITDHSISHGSIVTRMIRDIAPEALVITSPVSGEGESLQEGAYLDALRRVLDYKRRNPGRRVLVNISLGFRPAGLLHQQFISKLTAAGVVVIAAAGNEDNSEPIYPAAFPEVVAVASAEEGGKEGYSSFGSYVDISAPGSVEYAARLFFPDLLQTLRAAGTSFAAPRVTGLLASLLSRDSGLSPEEALQIIRETAKPITSILFARGLLGCGVINPERALAEVDPYFQFKKMGREWLLPALLLSLITIVGFWRGAAAVMSVFLFLLVILPALLLAAGSLVPLRDNLARVMSEANLGLADLLLLLLPPLAVPFLTGWGRRVLLLAYGGLITAAIFVGGMGTLPAGTVGEPGSQLYLLPFLGLGWGLLLFFLERRYLRRARASTSQRELFTFLTSSSERVRRVARERLRHTSLSEDGLLQMCTNPAARIREAVLEDLFALPKPPLKQLLYLARKGLPEDDEIVRAVGDRVSTLISQLLAILEGAEKEANDENYDGIYRAELEEGAQELLLKLARKAGERTAEEVLIRLGEGLLAGDFPDRVKTLAIMEKYSMQARDLPEMEGLLANLKQMVKDEDNGTWERFYALRLLERFAAREPELVLLLRDLQQDREELMRIEARGYLEEIGLNLS
ncbi:MAG: S8/S53 family peptidase [Halanaerobium sp.]|nr:S8/S53 family peptidase [Halanaerobium sp.]